MIFRSRVYKLKGITHIVNCYKARLVNLFCALARKPSFYHFFFMLLLLASSPVMALVDMKNSNYTNTWVDLDGLTKNKTIGGDVGFYSVIDLAISRTYNSRSLFDGIFGFGWCSDFETQLTITAEGNLRLSYCGAGEEIQFLRKDFSVGEIKEKVQEITSLMKKASTDKNGVGYFIGGFKDKAWRRKS